MYMYALMNFSRHVEVRTSAPQGYVFTIKVCEDVPPGSVGFSLVQVSIRVQCLHELRIVVHSLYKGPGP